MAMITEVRRADTWEGRPTETLAKFIPEHLMTFAGSAGDGGIEAADPIIAAKEFAVDADPCLDGMHIIIIDTQSPDWSDTHMKSLWPHWADDSNHATWQ